MKHFITFFRLAYIPMFKIVVSLYLLYIIFAEKGLRRHSPITWETLLLVISAMWLVNVLMENLSKIKNILTRKK